MHTWPGRFRSIRGFGVRWPESRCEYKHGSTAFVGGIRRYLEKMKQFRGRGSDIEVVIWIAPQSISMGVALARDGHRNRSDKHLPRYSTQLILMSPASPSGDSGTSSSNGQSTNGPSSPALGLAGARWPCPVGSGSLDAMSGTVCAHRARTQRYSTLAWLWHMLTRENS